jgi:chromosome segregation ATPase
MAEDSRVTALTTACDDLQAQLEAGDRSVRHVHYDLTELGATLASLTQHTEALAVLLQHMRELRANMGEQRKALREVRAAARALCASVTEAQENVLQLAEDAAHGTRSSRP